MSTVHRSFELHEHGVKISPLYQLLKKRFKYPNQLDRKHLFGQPEKVDRFWPITAFRSLL